ncbi:MAG: hypothetical protein SWO11_14340 [Thermodesulfobacteriota bacterium]|nr:hypothetical protein [Thermodesulfobacteriota bacterium]
MEKVEYVAWSLYTGPSNLRNVISDSNCPWIVGQWTGVNDDILPQHIQDDIELRISLLIKTFQNILPSYKTHVRNFIIPEFFFRCKQGPYPNIKVDGQNYPLEYVQLRLNQEFLNIIPDDNNDYNIVIGSILTSNIDDYTGFLNSKIVKQRLQSLNNVLPSGFSLSDKAGHSFWRRNLPSQDRKDLSNDLATLNDFMKECRANPLCTVRNRGIYFHYNRTVKSESAMYVYEKRNESTVDLTMGVFNEQNKIDPGGMITEWMANYPSYSIIKGDKQIDEFSTNARFTPPYLGEYDVGVEICLDHRLQRLRRTVDMTKECGADADNFPLFKQIIPSGGMQILDYSVAANKNSAIFNADACDKVYRVYGDEKTVILNGEAGKFKGITCGVYNQTIQSKWSGKDGKTYYSHSQLAFTTNDSMLSGFNNALGNKNEKALTFNGSEDNPHNLRTDTYNPIVISLQDDTNLFAAGTGEIHYYEPIADVTENSAT